MPAEHATGENHRGLEWPARCRMHIPWVWAARGPLAKDALSPARGSLKEKNEQEEEAEEDENEDERKNEQEEEKEEKEEDQDEKR